ncbi:MAG: hypothetical protein LQ350_004953 [Teloschistes chrysophthalmus]|nr:MAG: hypothetical protein LQ350_004953 [Niorma chrysophthalma]
MGTKYDKHAPFYAQPAVAGSFVNEVERKNYLPRKMVYEQEFNRDAIRRAEPRIALCVAKFLQKLDSYTQTEGPVNLSNAFLCMTVDAVTRFMYQKTYGALDADDFNSEFLILEKDFVKMMQWPLYLPRTSAFLFTSIERLPAWVHKRWLRGIVAQKGLWNMCEERIKYTHSGLAKQNPDCPRTVFDTTLNPDPEKQHSVMPIKHVVADAVGFVMAGSDTSAFTLQVAVFNLLYSKPDFLDHIKRELRGVIHDKDKMVQWDVLEKLPYLRATVKESLRLSHGAPGRLPRVVPKDTVLCGTLIKAGVSSTFKSVFPDPERFLPERWLENDPQLDRHMVSFSRGSRICLGMNLAYCVLYLTLAHLLRWYDLQLHETTEADMEWKDSFVSMMKGSLRVTVKRIPSDATPKKSLPTEKA